jgi:glycosyltransferase involved in cell wall biosynthesis
MKRVLMLAYLFPPIANSGTQRPLKFVKYLAEFGWQPTVMTAASCDGHPCDAGLLEDIPPGIDVVRVPMVHEAVAAALRTIAGPRLGGRLGDAVAWRLRHYHRSPDLYAWWRPTVRRAALRRFRQQPFDAVFATGFPWTSLLAGADIAAATWRPSVSDFRDLWAGESLFPRERRPPHEERADEHRVVHAARAVTAATTSQARWLSASYPDLGPDHFVAIHNGFDPDDLPPPAAPAPGHRFRIVYAGVWKEGYNPSQLYDAIKWLQRAEPRLLEGVEVIAAGFPPGHARRRRVDGIIREPGPLPHGEAVALMQSADLLYLSHADGDRQWAVPGKLYEYLASGRPVLALTPAAGETAQIIGRVGGGVAVDPDDPGALYDVVKEACRQKRIVVPPRDARALAAFDRRQLTAQLAAVLDRAAGYTARSTRAGSLPGVSTRSSYTGSTSAQPATRVVS